VKVNARENATDTFIYECSDSLLGACRIPPSPPSPTDRPPRDEEADTSILFDKTYIWLAFSYEIGAGMADYKWVSIYFEEDEYERLERVAEELRRRGVNLSKYALLKAWVLRVLSQVEGGDASWLEGLEDELEKGKVKARNRG